VRLFFDENLSVKLVRQLAPQFPDSSLVDLASLRGASDIHVWQHARRNGFIIVTKDDDFRTLSLLHGAPPKVVWLNVGNASTEQLATLISSQRGRIERFAATKEEALLLIRSAADDRRP
jgi:predicted nuclease of predicted toxin-antitoxin system